MLTKVFLIGVNLLLQWETFSPQDFIGTTRAKNSSQIHREVDSVLHLR